MLPFAWSDLAPAPAILVECAAVDVIVNGEEAGDVAIPVDVVSVSGAIVKLIEPVSVSGMVVTPANVVWSLCTLVVWSAVRVAAGIVL
jgi:hypothetical protein